MRVLICTLSCLVLLASPCPANARPPNLVLILADDLGYETIGANGGTSYRTPVLDRLAATGTRFTHCYVQPLCTPTRVQLMTGQYNVRNYTRFGEMDPNAVTFAHRLKAAGYATCIAGKWQLGRDRDLPKQFGFDEHCLWQHTRRPPRYANPGLEINGVEKDYNHGEYGPDLVNQYALDFIRRNQGSPFFLYYPMMLTHAPYQPTPDSPTWDPAAKGESVNRNPKHFADMVAYMDKLVGRLVTQLDGLGLRTNTLVLFVGDNGTGRGVRSQMGNRTVMGGKGLTLTTGMHVPLIANWPGTVAAGNVCGDLVDSTDFLPTLCAAAGVVLPQDLIVDGRSFLPQLQGQPGQPRDWVYSWYCPRPNTDTHVQEFAFNQHYKLYRDGRFFDLARDAEEKQPLDPGQRTGEAAAAARRLHSALDQFQGARSEGPAAEPCRLPGNPIVRPDMLPGADGANINGPSLIRAPGWLPNRLGTYYLYFAHHNGEYIRLAYANHLEGPWKVHAPGTLHLRDAPGCTGHIASPDVHVDDERREIRMYFHGPAQAGGGQKSFVAFSKDGVDFEAKPEPLGLFYFRLFRYQDHWFALAKGGVLHRSKDGLTPFERGHNPFPGAELRTGDLNEPGPRHLGLLPRGDTLWVYYTSIGDAPERVFRARLDLPRNWQNWRTRDPVEVLRPGQEWEGADLPIQASKAGAAKGRENALRDPAIFRDSDGRTYLLYSVAGESGIGIAEINP